MKVILLENVENVGTAGDVVEIADGYARNFLFPRGVAARATAGNITEAMKRRARENAAARLALEEVQRQVERIDGTSILVKRAVGPTGELFGAVTNHDIASELEAALRVKLPKGVVRLTDPIRQIGEKPVHLVFPHGLEADIIVIVEGEKPDQGKSR